MPSTTSVRRTASALAASALIVGACVAGAPAASATELSPACAILNEGVLNGTYGKGLIGGPFGAGEVITVTATNPADGASTFTMKVDDVLVGTVGIPGTGRVTLTETRMTNVGWETNNGNAGWTVTCAMGAAATPDWVQGTGRGSADEACADGWNPSWEQWPNGGTGGWVCVRSVPMYGAE